MAATQVAVLGAAPLSNAWKNSGLNSWTRFARRVLRQEAHECLPPTIDGLVAWATAFKSRGTFDNYCGGLKSTCMMWRLDVSAFKEEILWRAKVAISKRAPERPWNTWDYTGTAGATGTGRARGTRRGYGRIVRHVILVSTTGAI